MSSQQGVHIVSLDVPFPPDYGAMIDVYYRCQALKSIGVKVILHCFEYGRGKQIELAQVADEVYYYPRKKTIQTLFSNLPFVVKSRVSNELLRNLQKDEFPILFEGIHTCFYLNHPSLKNKTKAVRAHNIEHDYYEGLADVEPLFSKRLFYKIEAKKLKKYERIYRVADEIFTVSPKDTSYFQRHYQKGEYLPVFNPLAWGDGLKGQGDFALFHGNLSVIENENAFRFIADNVWSNELGLDLVIAGKNPSATFVNYIKKLPFSVRCVPNPSDEELNQLIRTAAVNLLPTFQNTGIKHKLLNCLANGGYCLANSPMVEGTGLEHLCELANTPSEWVQKIKLLSQTRIDENTLLQRGKELNELFFL